MDTRVVQFPSPGPRRTRTARIVVGAGPGDASRAARGSCSGSRGRPRIGAVFGRLDLHRQGRARGRHRPLDRQCPAGSPVGHHALPDMDREAAGTTAARFLGEELSESVSTDDENGQPDELRLSVVVSSGARI